MIGVIIKVLVALFVYIALPSIICKKRKYKQFTWQHFVNIACKVVGVTVMVYAGFDLIIMLIIILVS